MSASDEIAVLRGRNEALERRLKALGSAAGEVPPSLVGREVASRVLVPFFDALEARGLPPSALAEGTDRTPEELQDPRGRIPWSAFHRVLANAGRVWTPDELDALGTRLLGASFLKPFAVIARLLYSAPEFYQWTFGPSGPPRAWFAATEVWTHPLAPDRLRVELRMRRGYEPSRENHYVLRGTLRVMSAVLGYGEATVEMTERPDGVRYDIQLPATGGRLAWLRRLVTWPFTARAAGQELRVAHEALYERYLELQAEMDARATAEEARVDAERERDRARQLEALGRLVGGMAHDFNNLLSVVLAYTESLLAKGGPDAPGREGLLQIRRAGLRGTDLTRQMLALGRREAPMAAVHDLRDVVDGTAVMLARLLPASVKLDVRLPDEPVPVEADRGELEQVVLNLALNARDAMPEGGRLALWVSRTGESASLVVDDEGVGMDEATRQRAFEPFFTTKSKRAGSGLGLAQVQDVVQRSGGAVSVDTAPGQGTCVEVRLPLAAAERLPAEPWTPRSVTDEAPDDAALVDALRSALLARGFHTEAEGAFLSEHERWLVTLRSIGDGVVVTDEEGRVILLNPAAEEHTGWSAVDAVGRPVMEVVQLVDEFHREKLGDPVARVLSTRRAHALHDHTVLSAKDGQRYPVAFSIAPVLVGEDRLMGAVLVFRDMRARRRLEEELVRSAKLEALGSLAGNLAHDYNNVLAAIQGSASLALRKAQPSDPTTPLLRVISDAAERGAGLTRELLAFARGGAPVLEIVHLQDILRRAVTVATKDVRCEVRVDVADDLHPVRADAGQIQQAIQNLVRNGCRATPEGEALEVRARNETIAAGLTLPAAAGPYVRIEVADHGPGISEDRLSHIFDPFYADGAVATGLGLPTVHSIVHSHGGHVAVSSAAGVGTTFKILLPGASASPLSPEAPGEGAVPSGRRVLVMDDEPLVRETWRAVLDDLGYEVELVPEGDAAMEAYRQAMRDGHPFDLVVLDLVVPGGKGGVDTLRELMALDPRVRAIACSGYSPDPVMANHREYGFAGALTKPFGLDAVRRKLAQVLGETHAPEA